MTINSTVALIGVILTVLIAIATVAAAWGGARAGINGVKGRMGRVEEGQARLFGRLDQHIEDDHKTQRDTTDRLARIETKLDAYFKDAVPSD